MKREEKKQMQLRIFAGVMAAVMFFGIVAAAIILLI